MNKLAIYFLDNTKCPICGEEFIKYYDKKGNVISPTSKYDETYYAKCKICGNEYFLHWDTYNNIFKLCIKDPILNEFEKEFISSYKKRNIDNYI